MADLRKREQKASEAAAAAVKKKASGSSLFRFLSSKKPSAPNASSNLSTAKQLPPKAPTPSSPSKKSTTNAPVQSHYAAGIPPAARNATSTQSYYANPSIAKAAPLPIQPAQSNDSNGFQQRKLSHAPPPLEAQTSQQQLLDSLKVSTPPNADYDLGREVRQCESEPGTDPLETINSKIKNVMYKNDNEAWNNFWTVVEEATQVKRENIAYVLIGFISVLAIWSSLGDCVSTFVGFAYPSIATYKILNPSPRAPAVTNAECIHWFRYWSIFAFIQCIDVIFGKAFSVIPVYQICKVLVFLAAQYSHWNVSGFIYAYAVMPVVKWMKKFSDKYIFNK